MNRVKELSGLRAGKLVAQKYLRPDEYGRAIWLCKCDCGNLVERQSSIFVQAAKKNKQSNCGCDRPNKTHGLTKTNKRLYWVWASIVQRCENENSRDYKDYGGRGIKMHPAWRKDFRVFYEWAISSGYIEGLSIDRKNNDGDYIPRNCRWIPIQEQMMNQRKTVRIKWKGEEKTLREWCEITGLKYRTLKGRIVDLKWPAHKALTTPAIRGRNQHG
jgi:hypothetical protein